MHFSIFLFSPLWRFCYPFWYSTTLVGGIFLDPISFDTPSRCQSSPVLWALPRVMGGFNEIYSLSGWMTPYFFCVDHHAGSFPFLSLLACERMFCVCSRVAFIISHFCGTIPHGWVTELLFLLVYISVGFFFFIRSIFRI